ncbi:unnamed protein product, partial [Ectocarpus sp. 12 AP-2014]
PACLLQRCSRRPGYCSPLVTVRYCTSYILLTIMSGSEPLFPFAWGALRLVSSLLTASFKKKLVGVEEERTRAMGDVVLKARDKSRRTKQQGRGDGDAAMRAVEQHGHE